MAAASVFRIAYVDLATADVADALEYYTGAIGARLTEDGGAGRSYLSLGVDHHNISLQSDGPPGLVQLGLQVGGDLQEMAQRVEAAGIPAEWRSDTRPGVGRVLRLGPVGGHVIELLSEMAMPAPGFATSGVVPNRIGHVALLTPEPDHLVALLTGPLGFAITDWFEDAVTFLTCNRDHHVVNVIAAPIVKLHHLAFELRGRDHQTEAADLLARRGRPTVWGPSRHTAGHNLASYHYGPDRTLIELYTDMDVYIPELGCFEPRPWHQTLPQRPRHWKLSEMTTWGTPYGFDFRTA